MVTIFFFLYSFKFVMFSCLKTNPLLCLACIHACVVMLISGNFIYNLCACSSNLQIWTSSNVPNAQGPPDFLGEYPSQDVSTPAQESNSDAKSKPLASETKSGGRKELPVVTALPNIVSAVSHILLMVYIQFSAGPFYYNHTHSRPNSRLANFSTLWHGI